MFSFTSHHFINRSQIRCQAVSPGKHRNNSEPGLSNKYELEIDLTCSSVFTTGPDFSSGKIKRDIPSLTMAYRIKDTSIPIRAG